MVLSGLSGTASWSSRLERFGDSSAIVWRDVSVSYRELCDQAAEFQQIIRDAGVRAGDVVAFRGDFSPRAVALLIALVDGRQVAVPLGAASEDQHERSEIAQASVLLDLDGEDGLGFHRFPRRTTENSLFARLRADGEAGLVLFSSGSTGRPKALLHSFDRLLAKFARPRPPRRTLSFLLLDHGGGVNTLLGALTGGGTVVVPGDRSPDTVCGLIERHHVQLLPATPTFLNMLLLTAAHQRYDLSSLEIISYGAEPMPAFTLDAVHRALPGARLKQTYGLSEIGGLATRSESDDSLWIALGGEGYETKVVDGTLRVRSETAMLGYLNAPSPFDADGWMDTGDAVQVRGEYMRILGRRSELINVGGEKVFPQEVENVIHQVPNVRDAFVEGVPSPLVGNVVVATVRLVAPEDPAVVARRVREFCRGRLDPFKVPATVSVTGNDFHTERMKKARKAVSDG